MSKTWYADLPKYYQRQIAQMGLDDAGMTRRHLLKAAGAAVAIAGSGIGTRAAQAARATISYMCWEGYNDPRIVDTFKAENGCDMVFDLIVDSAGGFAKLQAGASREVDVVSTDLPWVTRMGPAGLAMELDDKEFVDIYATFYDQFKPPFEPLNYEGKNIGIATRWGWVGPCINLDNTTEAEWSTYDPVFNPAYKNKICVMDWGDWPILPMTLHAGIDPYKELDTAELDEVRKVLRAMFKNTRTLVSDISLAQKGLLDGSLTGCIGAGTYVTSALRKQGHTNIKAIVPDVKEGLKQGIVWVEASAILKDTDQPELSKKLVKHMVSKGAARTLSLLDSTCNLVTNASVEATYTAKEREILQADYMWHAWDNSQMHRIAPSIDEMLQIWQEELVNAG